MEPDWADYEVHLEPPDEGDAEPAIEFQWDAGNIDHMAFHDVRPEEAVEVFYNDHLDFPEYVVDGETRYDKVGRTDAGRILLVAYTFRGHLVRVVNAMTPNQEDIRSLKRRYPDEPQ